mgnify:CR=1 FL=1
MRFFQKHSGIYFRLHLFSMMDLKHGTEEFLHVEKYAEEMISLILLSLSSETILFYQVNGNGQIVAVLRGILTLILENLYWSS